MSYQNLVFNQDNNFYLISLSILNSCLLGNVSILQGEDTCLSLLAVKGVILSAHKSCGTASCYRKHSNQKKNANKPSNLELTPVKFRINTRQMSLLSTPIMWRMCVFLFWILLISSNFYITDLPWEVLFRRFVGIRRDLSTNSAIFAYLLW